LSFAIERPVIESSLFRSDPRRGRTSRRGSELLSDADPSLVFADDASGPASLVNRDLDALAAHRTSEHAAGRTKRASVFQVSWNYEHTKIPLQ
jgi:hypothetical protein